MSSTGSADEKADSIARLAQTYDELQYDSSPFPYTQPARLAGIAHFFGLDVAPLDTARVLELGCAAGGNLIPHGVYSPNASFVGVDISQAQIDAGRARIGALGLANVELRCASLTDIDESWGRFDYIICHGVHSWVPEEVQDAIFRVISERFSPLGVASVSYNVLPGFRVFQPFRDSFLLTIPEHLATAERVIAARDLLAFMHARSADPGPYGNLLRVWGERLATSPDYYLAHDYLEHANLPTSVKDFTTAAARHGLGYLSDCDISTMVTQNYGPEIADYVQSHAKGDLIETEQYLDIICGRDFRRSLLIADERMPLVKRETTPESLAGRHLLTRDGLSLEQDGDGFVARDASGVWVRTTSRSAAEGVAALIRRFPSSSTIEDCLAALPAHHRQRDRPALLETLHRMVLANLINLTLEPVHAATAGEKPRAIALARFDAAAGAQSTTSMRHETKPLDPVMCILLPAMDGTRDRAALTGLLEQAMLTGKLSVMHENQPVTDPAGIRQLAAKQLSTALVAMARLGILEG